MFEWSEEQLAIRDAVRRFIEEEIKPNVDELEHGDTPPYEVIRKLYATFGLDAMARESLQAPAGAQAGRARPSAARAPSEGGGNAGPDPHPDHRAVPLLPRASSPPSG